MMNNNIEIRMFFDADDVTSTDAHDELISFLDECKIRYEFDDFDDIVEYRIYVDEYNALHDFGCDEAFCVDVEGNEIVFHCINAETVTIHTSHVTSISTNYFSISFNNED